MANFVVAVVLLLIISGASIYIFKEKKKGVKCIGCPSAGACAHARETSGCRGNCR